MSIDTRWRDSDDALPIGVPRRTGPSGGRHLGLVRRPAPRYIGQAEYTRVQLHPELYDEPHAQNIIEMFLIVNRLTEWECESGHTVLTPDAEFSVDSLCSCGSK